MRPPTIREECSATLAEATAAKHWRKAVMGLSRAELARLTGTSVSMIEYYERGFNSAGQKILPRTYTRYRLICAAVHMRLTGWRWR